MKTNKKAGILVGAVLILLAILVSWLGTRGGDEGAKEAPKSTPVVQQTAPAQTEKVETKTRPVESSEAAGSGDSAVSTPVKPAPKPVAEPKAEPKVVVPDVDQYTNGVKGAAGSTENTAITVLREADLGKASQNITAPMVVIAKNVVLLDQQQGETSGKQLVYQLDLTGGTDLKLSLYVNGTAYDGLQIGDKLNVTYKVYKNKEDVQFPIIVSAEKPKS